MNGNRRIQDLFINRFVYYYLKFLGACPFKISNENILVPYYFTIIYPSILCIFYIIIFGFMVKFRTSFMFPCETPISVISDVLSVILEFLTVMSIWINAAFFQNVLCDVITGFSDLFVSLRPFGMEVDESNIMKKLNYLVLLVNATYFLFEIFTLRDILFELGYVGTFVWITFNFYRVLSHIFTVIFIYTLTILKRHLYFVNEFIRKFFINFKNLSEVMLHRQRIKCYDNQVTCLRALAKVHTDIQKLLKMVEIYFRAPILFFLLTHFINIASYFYVICVHLKKVPDTTVTPTFLIFLLWLIIHVVEVLATIEAVNSVVLQGNYTGNAIHRMITEYYPTDVVNAVKVISLQILQEPMKFSLYGFIDLNPSLLYRVFSAMTTYFVIMIQLDIQNKSDENKC